MNSTQTAIGATVTIQWVDSPEENTFEEYISFGQYDEDNEDEACRR